jgi:hypothetical protein
LLALYAADFAAFGTGLQPHQRLPHVPDGVRVLGAGELVLQVVHPADPTPEEEVDLDTVELMPIDEVLEGLIIAVGAQATEVDADKYGLVLRNLDAALITFNSIK